MPCSNSQGITSGDIAQAGVDGLRRQMQGLLAEVDGLTAALCGLCRSIEDSGDPRIGHLLKSPALERWWRHHRDVDKRRL